MTLNDVLSKICIAVESTNDPTSEVSRFCSKRTNGVIVVRRSLYDDPIVKIHVIIDGYFGVKKQWKIMVNDYRNNNNSKTMLVRNNRGNLEFVKDVE